MPEKQTQFPNLFLVGMPGSGKSTLGRKLAEALGYDFVDMDDIITINEKQSVPEIFETQGEAYFRLAEQKALKQVIAGHKQIIATGGGVPCFFDNMAVINQHGISIFLDITVQTLVGRLDTQETANRPLLSQTNDLLHLLSNKRDSRLPFYTQAHLHLPENVATDANKAIAAILDFLRNQPPYKHLLPEL